MKRAKVSLVLGAAVLVMAVLTLALGALVRRDPAPWRPLGERMPMDINGWRGEDVPLGETESILKAVSRLNYTDYIYRRYTRGQESIYIYAMFWRQGQISIREMAGHTPDGCWVANGAKYAAPPRQEDLSLPSGRTPKGEVRSFNFSGANAPINVIWWHILGDELVPENFGQKSIRVMVHELWLWLVHRRGQPADQIFVRIHGLRTVAEFDQNPVVQNFVSLFPQLEPKRSQPAPLP